MTTSGEIWGGVDARDNHKHVFWKEALEKPEIHW